MSKGNRHRERAQQITGKLKTGAVIGHVPDGGKMVRTWVCYNCDTVVHKPQQCPRCGVAIR